MKLIEAEKVKRVMKDYWKAQVDKALTLTFIDDNEANKRINSYLEHNHELLKAIDELPSAEQDTTTHDSIPAKTGKNDGDGTSGDCIGRQVAIDALDCINGTEEVLRSLPSIQPERKKGTWTDDASCPFCGFKPWYERDIHTLSFCPNCGADNRGKTE